jgi:hypothetical protein
MSGTYSLLDVNFSIVGPNISTSATGVAEEGYTPAFEEDSDVMTQGVGGVMHSLTVAKRGAVELHILKTSPMNAQLNYAYIQDRANGSQQWGQNVITITNPVSGDNWNCKSCAFRRHPSTPYQVRGSVHVWTFNSGEMDPILGNLTPNT